MANSLNVSTFPIYGIFLNVFDACVHQVLLVDCDITNAAYIQEHIFYEV